MSDVFDKYFDKMVEDFKNSPEGKALEEDWKRRVWVNVTCRRCGSTGRVFVAPEQRGYYEKKWQCCPSPRLNLWKRIKEAWGNLMSKKSA